MNTKKSRHSSLFLLELIAAIFFFCLAGTVCIRFFVKSHTLSQDAHNLDMAVNQAATFAERFQQEDDMFAFLEEQYPDGALSDDGDSYTLYYDGDWIPCEKSAGSFYLTVRLTKDRAFCTAAVTVTGSAAEDEIYTLRTEKSIAGEVGLS